VDSDLLLRRLTAPSIIEGREEAPQGGLRSSTGHWSNQYWSMAVTSTAHSGDQYYFIWPSSRARSGS